MSDTSILAPAAKRPWHLWAVGVISLLWNAFGGYDYVMTKTSGEAYLRGMGFNDAQVSHFLGYPGWMTAVWAVGVWGAVLGSVLLLFGSRFAFHAFVASLAGLLVSMVYTFGLSGGGALFGTMQLVMNVVIALVCLLLVVYSRAMVKRGVLR